MVGVAAIPLLWQLLAMGSVRFLHPLTISSLFFILGYVMPAADFLAGRDTFSLLWFNEFQDLAGTVATAQLLAAVALLSFQFGFVVAARGTTLSCARAPIRATVWRDDRLAHVAMVYTLVGLGLFTVGVVLVGGPAALLGGLNDRLRLTAGLNYFFSAINLLFVVAMLWYVRVLASGRLPSPGLWILSGVSLAAIALQGSKSIVFVGVVALAVAWERYRRPIGIPVILMGAGVLFLVLVAYALVFREFLVLGQLVTVDLRQLDGELVFALLRRGLADEFVQLQVLSVIVEQVPGQLAFQHGTTFVSLITSVIPAHFFPSKPLMAPGVLAMAMWPDRWLVGGTTMPPGLVGEFYMNFGPVGVSVGMAVFGSLFGGLHRRVSLRPTPTTIVAYSLAVAMLVHYLRGEAVSPTVLLLLLLLPSLVALRVVTGPRPGGERR